MRLGAYLKDLEEARRARVLANNKIEKLFAEVNLTVQHTRHFNDRFVVRASQPLQAVHSFELAMLIVRRNIERIIGKTAAIKVKQFVFILDGTKEGHIRCVTFWRTEQSAEEALRNRADICIEHA